MKKPQIIRKPNKTIVVYHYGRKIKTISLTKVKLNKARLFFMAAMIITPLYVSCVFLNQAMAEIGDVPQPAIVRDIVITKDATRPPILGKIALCESGDRHYAKSGKVLTNTTGDYGRYQINKAVWSKKAQELGYDLMTPEGNEAMAIWLLENYGSVPWKASGKCWAIK